MKNLILALLLVSTFAQADEWSNKDKALLAGAAVLHTLDWKQTRDITNHPDLQEMNPILGSHPSAGEINTFFITSGVLVYGVAEMFPKYRTAWLTTFDIIKIGVVGHNYSIGLRFNF